MGMQTCSCSLNVIIACKSNPLELVWYRVVGRRRKKLILLTRQRKCSIFCAFNFSFHLVFFGYSSVPCSHYAGKLWIHLLYVGMLWHSFTLTYRWGVKNSLRKRPSNKGSVRKNKHNINATWRCWSMVWLQVLNLGSSYYCIKKVAC